MFLPTRLEVPALAVAVVTEQEARKDAMVALLTTTACLRVAISMLCKSDKVVEAKKSL